MYFLHKSTQNRCYQPINQNNTSIVKKNKKKERNTPTLNCSTVAVVAHRHLATDFVRDTTFKTLTNFDLQKQTVKRIQ